MNKSETKTLREIIDDAAFSLDCRKDTDVSECQAALADVFESTPAQFSGPDLKLEMITESNATEMVYFVLDYRGREKRLYVIPASIFNAPDPRVAALDWDLDVQVRKTNDQIQLVAQHLEASKKTLQRLMTEQYRVEEFKRNGAQE
jgi:hypothetical protein